MNSTLSVSLAYLCLAAPLLYAAGPDADLVVTGTRTERDPHEVPYSISRVPLQKDLMTKMPRTMPEALARQPSVLVQQTGHAQGSPYIRGFTGYRTLFLIDGVRLNNSAWRDGPNQYWGTVDIYSVDQLELVRGPHSTLFGSDALGGTVNARTISPMEEGWEKKLYYRYSDAENSHIARTQVSGSWNERWSFVGGVTLKDFGDLEGGSEVGPMPNTAYEEMAWDGKLVYDALGGARWTFAHYGVEQDDAWRTHKTIYGTEWHGLVAGNEKARILDQSRTLSYVKYEQSVDAPFADSVDATLSHQHHEEEQYRVRDDDRWDLQGFDLNTVGMQVQLGKTLDQQNWTYGLEFYRDEVDSFKTGVEKDLVTVKDSIQGPLADDASYETLGIYAQNEVELTERSALIAGARYNYAEADADRVQDALTGELTTISDDWDQVVGSLRLRSWVAEDQRVQVFAGVSQGFRAPNLSDLTRLDSARSNEIETPSPGLEPEELISYEAGVKMLNDHSEFTLATYYADVSDMIVRTPTGRVIDGENEITKKNGGDGYVTGVEIAGSLQPTEQIHLWCTASWMDGEVETFPTSEPVMVQESIDRLMPLTVNAGIKWADPEDQCWVELVTTWADEADKLSTRDKQDTQRIPPGGTPDYWVVGIRTGMQLRENLLLSVAVENLMDEDYRVHGSGLNAPGRNFMMAVEARF